MERRMRGNSHVRCEWGEKLEITSKVYLSPFGTTRAEERLYLTCAQCRTIFGRTGYNSPSRFIHEISQDILEHVSKAGNRTQSTLPFGASRNNYDRTSYARSQGSVQKTPPVTRPKPTGAAGLDWKIGDKVAHKVFGTGMVVGISGEGDELELKVAFPNAGIKELLASLAPITKA